MRTTKVVLIGAASAAFGPALIADILTIPDVRGSTLCLVDVDADGLQLMRVLAERMNREWESGVRIEATTDRVRALPGADFVIVAVERERMKRWRMDWEIPLRHGLRQPAAENGGPGGFAHAARNIPIVLGICEDMQKLCPEAWLLNLSNPVTRLTLAASRYGRVKAIGFCHGIGIAYDTLSELLHVPTQEMDVKAAGLNHFTWVLDIRRRTGEDLYPALRARLSDWPERFMPLTRDLFGLLGLFPAIGDHHIAEYLPVGWVSDAHTKPEYNLLTPVDWEQRDVDHREWVERTNRMAAGEAPLDGLRQH